MAFKAIDDRQIVNRSALSISIGSAANTTLDVVFSTIDGKMVNLSGIQNITNKIIGTSSSNILSNSLQFVELTSTPSTNPPSGDLAIYPKTDGFFYVLNSSGSESKLGSFVPTTPNLQYFILTGTQTGYVFAVSSANATIGATYANNSNTYVVQGTIVANTLLFMSGTGTLSGTTLTKTSGTGDATITFSNATPTATYTVPTSPITPLYLEIEAVGAGGGGGGVTGSSGTATYFGANIFIVNGGNSNGTTGTAFINSPAATVYTTGGTAGGNIISNSANVDVPGGIGGSSFFGGGGQGGQGANGAGQSATGYGSGGGGGSVSNGGSAGNGGGPGAYTKGRIYAPFSSTYPYAIGVGGIGQPGSTNYGSGGNGYGGIVVVTAYFQ